MTPEKCNRCLFSEECHMNPGDCGVMTPIEEDFVPMDPRGEY